MSISITSDIHVRDVGSGEYRYLLKFLNHPKVRSSSEVYLLGDIFDLMIGNHGQYISRYQDFFSCIKKMLEEGIKIHFFEGNHDLHLKKMFQNEYFEFFNKKLFFHERPYSTEIEGKKYFFSHGDEIQPGQYGYKLYKKLINSIVINILVNRIIPFKYVDSIGNYFSKKSREHYRPSAEIENYVRDSFRLGAMSVAAKGFEVVVCGHSHIKDFFLGNQFENPFIYINNGFAAEENSFIYIENAKIDFITLE